MEVGDHKLPYKIHGIIVSDSDSDSSSLPEFDEDYKLYQPPPLSYDLIKDKIVKISAPAVVVHNVWEDRLKCTVNAKNDIKDEANISTAGISMPVAKTKKKKKKKQSGPSNQNSLISNSKTKVGVNSGNKLNVKKPNAKNGKAATNAHTIPTKMPPINVPNKEINSMILSNQVGNNKKSRMIISKPTSGNNVPSNISSSLSKKKKERKGKFELKNMFNNAQLNVIERNLEKIQFNSLWKCTKKETDLLKQKEKQVYANWYKHASEQANKAYQGTLETIQNSLPSFIEAKNTTAITTKKKNKKNKKLEQSKSTAPPLNEIKNEAKNTQKCKCDLMQHTKRPSNKPSDVAGSLNVEMGNKNIKTSNVEDAYSSINSSIDKCVEFLSKFVAVFDKYFEPSGIPTASSSHNINNTNFKGMITEEETIAAQYTDEDFPPLTSIQYSSNFDRHRYPTWNKCVNQDINTNIKKKKKKFKPFDITESIEHSVDEEYEDISECDGIEDHYSHQYSPCFDINREKYGNDMYHADLEGSLKSKVWQDENLLYAASVPTKGGKILNENTNKKEKTLKPFKIETQCPDNMMDISICDNTKYINSFTTQNEEIYYDHNVDATSNCGTECGTNLQRTFNITCRDEILHRLNITACNQSLKEEQIVFAKSMAYQTEGFVQQHAEIGNYAVESKENVASAEAIPSSTKGAIKKSTKKKKKKNIFKPLEINTLYGDDIIDTSTCDNIKDLDSFTTQNNTIYLDNDVVITYNVGINLQRSISTRCIDEYLGKLNITHLNQSIKEEQLDFANSMIYTTEDFPALNKHVEVDNSVAEHKENMAYAEAIRSTTQGAIKKLSKKKKKEKAFKPLEIHTQYGNDIMDTAKCDTIKDFNPFTTQNKSIYLDNDVAKSNIGTNLQRTFGTRCIDENIGKLTITRLNQSIKEEPQVFAKPMIYVPEEFPALNEHVEVCNYVAENKENLDYAEAIPCTIQGAVKKLSKKKKAIKPVEIHTQYGDDIMDTSKCDTIKDFNPFTTQNKTRCIDEHLGKLNIRNQNIKEESLVFPAPNQHVKVGNNAAQNKEDMGYAEAIPSTTQGVVKKLSKKKKKKKAIKPLESQTQYVDDTIDISICDNTEDLNSFTTQNKAIYLNNDVIITSNIGTNLQTIFNSRCIDEHLGKLNILNQSIKEELVFAKPMVYVPEDFPALNQHVKVGNNVAKNKENMAYAEALRCTTKEVIKKLSKKKKKKKAVKPLESQTQCVDDTVDISICDNTGDSFTTQNKALYLDNDVRTSNIETDLQRDLLGKLNMTDRKQSIKEEQLLRTETENNFPTTICIQDDNIPQQNKDKKKDLVFELDETGATAEDSLSFEDYAVMASDHNFGEEFKDFLDNINSDRHSDILCSLSDFNYEQIHRAYIAYYRKTNDQRTAVINKSNIDTDKSGLQKTNNIAESTEITRCLRCLSSDVKIHYYEFIGENFAHFMNFRELYLSTSLDLATKNKEKMNSEVKKPVGSNAKRKRFNRKRDKVKKEIRELEILKDQISYHYYDFEGENFDSFMEFKELYCSMSLDAIVKKKGETADKQENVVNKDIRQLEIIKDKIRCNYYDFQGENLELYCSTSLDAIAKSKGEPVKKQVNIISTPIATNAKRKRFNRKREKVNKEVPELEILKDEIPCHYYDFEGENFDSFMEFRELNCSTSLDTIAKTKGETVNKQVNIISTPIATNAKRKRFNRKREKVNKEIRKLELLKDEIPCHYYDFEGENFDSFMEFKELYCSTSLDAIAKRRGETADKQENVVNKDIRQLEIIKDQIRCNYYDFQGENLELYCSTSLDAIAKSKGEPVKKQVNIISTPIATNAKRKRFNKKQESKVNKEIRALEILKNEIPCHCYDFEGQNFHCFIEFRELYCSTSLDAIAKSKGVTVNKQVNIISTPIATNAKRKRFNRKRESKVNKEIRALEILKDEMLCHCYDFEGENFDSFMEFKELYCSTSLDAIAKRIGETVNKQENMVNKDIQALEIMKDEIRCHYHDFRDDNFHSFMIFREHYLYSSIEGATQPESKLEIVENTQGTNSDVVNNSVNLYRYFQQSHWDEQSNEPNVTLFLKILHVAFIFLLLYLTNVFIKCMVDNVIYIVLFFILYFIISYDIRL